MIPIFNIFKKKKDKIAIICHGSLKQSFNASIIIRNLKSAYYNNIFCFINNDHYKYIEDTLPFENTFIVKKDLHEVQHNFIAEQFQTVIDLVDSESTRAFFKSLDIRNVINHYSQPKSFIFNIFSKNKTENKHPVDVILNKLSVKNDAKGLIFNTKNAEKIKLIDLFDPFIYSMMYHGGYYIFFIATSEFSTKQIIEICENIESPVLLMNTDQDKTTTSYIAKETGPNIIDATSLYDIKYFNTIIEQSKAVISFENDILSIMSAFDKPTYIIKNSNQNPSNAIYIHENRVNLPKYLTPDEFKNWLAIK